jgi:penicillin-binding protein 2
MNDDRIYEDLSLAQKRSRLVFFAVAGLFVLAALAYWKLQILDFKKYWALSEANRTREVVLPAPRGVLADRSGKVLLADNRASFKASFIRENTRDLDGSVRRIAGLLGLEEGVLRARIDKYRALASFQPIVVKDGLDLEEVARIEARSHDLPELVIETEPRRTYPFGTLAAHVLGFMQEVTMDELRSARKEQDRRPGDMIGRTGVEAAYEERVLGTEGKIVEVVDSRGRTRNELERIEPRPSPKLRLSLDYDLQAKAEGLLAGKEGAIVALDPATGEVLALASFPTYDPNKFINRFTPDEWLELVRNPDNPLLDRALQGQYSPGSLFKTVMALGALDSGLITAGTTFFCGGSADFYGRPRRCWFEPGHGSLNLAEAIRNSCNIYFYNLGQRMGVDAIARYAMLAGLGRRTGIEIAGEKEGLVPSTEWRRATTKAPWFPGETISVAIGQGPLQVTPLQVAGLAAFLANRGRSVRPRLTVSEEGPEPSPGPATPIAAETFESVIEGMWRSVNAGGTGQSARVDGFDVCGKTGSTQTVSRETAEKLSSGAREKKTHAWFMGFAPRRDPRIVVAVLVEYGGMGGATAGPIAGELFRLYKDKHDRPGAAQGD